MGSYSKADYEWYKARHICVACKKNRAFDGMTMCPECLERNSQRTTDWRTRCYEKSATYFKSRYDRLKAEGRCTKCGKPSPNGNTRCHACARRMKLYKMAKRVRKVKLDGICRYCGKPVYDGKKLCYKHWLKAAGHLLSIRPDTANHPWRRNKKARIMEIKEKNHGQLE